MTTADVGHDPELLKVLFACLSRWETQALPPAERAICYTSVARCYREQFGGKFHPSKLQRLAKLGFLAKDDTSRRGHRRYYTIVDPPCVTDLLRQRAVS